LNRARPGDTVMLARGATFIGNYVLPVKEGSDRPITVRTAGDEGFPPEGARMTPDAADALAKLRSPNGSSTLATAPGTRNWRITLLEFLSNVNSAGDIIALGDVGANQNALAKVPANLVLDRLYIHGDPDRGQKRGISLNSSDTSITGCYISDIRMLGQDSQAIGGWNGPGNFTIENNYLEAASENIMFGGGDPSILELTPTHIVVRNNFFSKPLTWRNTGRPWSIKNLFELKNARNVLVEGNVFERSWVDAQTGYGVLFTVRNQDGGCPWCQVEDVEFRNNIVRDVSAGIQILGTDSNRPSRQTNNIRIHDNIFDGIDRVAWGGDGYFLQLSLPSKDVTFDHNTIVQKGSGGVIKIANGVTTGFVFTNNIAAHGDYGIIGTSHGVGNDSINFYLPGAKIANNVLAGGKSTVYPPGNLFPSMDEFRQQFVGFDSHNYQLAPRSPWVNAGSDGRNLGANMTVANPEPGDGRPPLIPNRRRGQPPR
jgi:hypothetical protein